MGMAMLRQDDDQEIHRLAGEALIFDKLRELTRSGYLPDAESSDQGAGILLRHATGPDLILQPDGSIDLPLGQAARPAVPAPVAPPRMAKLRTLMIVIMATTFWFLSLAFTASILEGM